MAHDPIDFIRDQLTAIDQRSTRIEGSVDRLIKHMMDHPPCPLPGKCLELERQTKVLFAKTDAHSERISKIEKWQAWTMGIGGVLVTIVTLFASTLRKLLGLE
jgi:hypothetical protein